MMFHLRRRAFLQVTAAGAAACWAGGTLAGAQAAAMGDPLISPGARRSKVRVAKVYLGIPNAHWPTPAMDLAREMEVYEDAFAQRAAAFGDVEFPVNQLVTTVEGAQEAAAKLAGMDGVLAIHLSMGVTPMLQKILAAGTPTMLFAAPYSGHEWTHFGQIMRNPEGALLDCVLTSDLDQLAAAVRPFRAMHHLREAKIVNVSERESSAEYLQAVRTKFGTEIVRIERDRVLAAYEAVPEAAAKAEARQWIANAEKVVEPSTEEIENSCRLALAFERLLQEEDATTITVDCYGTMYRKLPAFPCIGFTRLNDMGFAGICESDLKSAMTFILMQSLSGNPGFISDPTLDESKPGIILAHCLGSTKMHGPAGEASPYRIRSIMERQEGAVTQVFMPVGQKVTQAELIGTEKILYFTGDVLEAPDTDRGCRTKVTVKVDGDLETLWQNWSEGLHRVTCYGDLRTDLKRFCRFKQIELVDEAKKVTA